MFPNFNKEYRQNSGMRLSRVVAVSSTKERARCVRDMHSTSTVIGSHQGVEKLNFTMVDLLSTKFISASVARD